MSLIECAFPLAVRQHSHITPCLCLDLAIISGAGLVMDGGLVFYQFKYDFHSFLSKIMAQT